MRTVQDYITTIRQNGSKITNDFGIKTLRIFGSVSRNEQTEQSDLDVCVETETPNPFLLANLKEYLESLFHCSVDVFFSFIIRCKGFQSLFLPSFRGSSCFFMLIIVSSW